MQNIRIHGQEFLQYSIQFLKTNHYSPEPFSIQVLEDILLGKTMWLNTSQCLRKCPSFPMFYHQ